MAQDGIDTVVDTASIANLSYNSMSGFPWRPMEFDEFEWDTGPDYYRHTCNFTRDGYSNRSTNVTGGEVQTNWLGIDILGAITGEPMDDLTFKPVYPDRSVAFNGTGASGWNMFAPKLEDMINVRAVNTVEVSTVKFSESHVKSTITSGLNGGKLEYDFELSVPYPNVWTHDNGVPTLQTSYNAIIVDGHVIAMIDGGVWYDKQGLYAVAEVM